MLLRTRLAALAGLLALLAVHCVGERQPFVEEEEAAPALLSPGAELPSPPTRDFMQRAVSLRRRTPEDPGPGMLHLPDGTWIEPLNGVHDPPPLRWPEKGYSPIVGKRRGPGPDAWWWYVHADGTMSTTALVRRGDLGRPDVTTIVVRPHGAAPILEGGGRGGR
jgi:hypothetical protein